VWVSQKFTQHHAKIKWPRSYKECARREQEASCGVEAFRPSSSVLASYPDEIVFIIGLSGMTDHSANNAVKSASKYQRSSSRDNGAAMRELQLGVWGRLPLALCTH
jgi:hypothetical protein